LLVLHNDNLAWGFGGAETHSTDVLFNAVLPVRLYDPSAGADQVMTPRDGTDPTGQLKNRKRISGKELKELLVSTHGRLSRK
jgi:hypothetical protein